MEVFSRCAWAKRSAGDAEEFLNNTRGGMDLRGRRIMIESPKSAARVSLLVLREKSSFHSVRCPL